jgi:hypothetical protein
LATQTSFLISHQKHIRVKSHLKINKTEFDFSNQPTSTKEYEVDLFLKNKQPKCSFEQKSKLAQVFSSGLTNVGVKEAI